MDKFTLYQKVVGRDPYKGKFGERPTVNVQSEQQMSDIYIAIKQFEKNYDNEEDKTYFGNSLNKIHNAWNKNNIKGFTEGLEDLMMDIDMY